MFAFALASSTCSEAASAKIRCLEFSVYRNTRACLKNHSCNLHAPICGIFCLHSVDVAPATPPSFRRNLPQIVTHILQKAFFKHALKECWIKLDYYPLSSSEIEIGYGIVPLLSKFIMRASIMSAVIRNSCHISISLVSSVK